MAIRHVGVFTYLIMSFPAGKTKYLLEYAMLRVLSFILCVLPYRAALAVGWGIAWLGFNVAGFRRAEAQARIREIFGESMSVGAIRRTAWISWRNFIFSGVEMIRIPVTSPQWIRSVVKDENMEPMLELIKQGRGVIIAPIHMGSWEMAGRACMTYGIPMFSLAAKQKNPYVDNYMNKLRVKTGFETLARSKNVLKGIVNRIKSGKALAILPDLRSPTKAVTVQFLGKQANVGGGLGLIARQTGAPVFPVIITRRGWARHSYKVFGPLYVDKTSDKHEDWRRITQQAFDIYDKHVRAEPEQWFWFNKRWLFDPVEDKQPDNSRI